MKQKTILLTTTLLILAACSQSEIETEEQRAPKEIKATSVIEGASTRATIQGDVALSNLTFLRVDDASNNPSSYDFSTNDEITGCSRADNGGKITFSTAPKYDQTSNKYAYLRGFTTENAASSAKSNTVWTIDGATDILMTDVWNAGKYDDAKTTGMTFKHLLSRIEVICKAEPTSTSTIDVVRAAWGNVTGITVLGVNKKVTYTYNNNTIAYSETDEFALLKEYTSSSAFEAKEIHETSYTGNADAVAMIPPITATDNHSFQLKITTTKVTEGLTVNVSLDNSNASMEAGKIHKVTLSFKADGKNISIASSTIDPWSDGSTGETNVTKPTV
jgi:hypothetical protein